MDRDFDGRLINVDDLSIARASSGACSIVRNDAQRDREASLENTYAPRLVNSLSRAEHPTILTA